MSQMTPAERARLLRLATVALAQAKLGDASQGSRWLRDEVLYQGEGTQYVVEHWLYGSAGDYRARRSYRWACGLCGEKP